MALGGRMHLRKDVYERFLFGGWRKERRKQQEGLSGIGCLKNVPRCRNDHKMTQKIKIDEIYETFPV